MAGQTDFTAESFDWQPNPLAGRFVDELIGRLCRHGSDALVFARRLHRQTGTRLIDWIDHLGVRTGDVPESQLVELGFQCSQDKGWTAWEHPGGLFPPIVIDEGAPRRLVVRAESVVDFLTAQGVAGDVVIEGAPLGRLRRARVASASGTQLWVVERHGYCGWEPPEVSSDQAEAVVVHRNSFRRRKRDFSSDADGFEHARRLIGAAGDDLGVDWACDLFFSVEREYWTIRNAAARTQKARQDALGLGWGNHDHHTYRSSRENFHQLVAVLKQLGMVCRERFHAGREAGWGAQVLEQPVAGLVVFADVDLSADEVFGDFARQGLVRSDRLGTIGLWCRLHGESFLEAGMHHLECRFDFDAASDQLQRLGIRTMKPFTNLAYLKQAFTEGEIWAVDEHRLQAAVAEGLVTPQQADRFRKSGATGSHLEILQRDDGYKGFNQAGISQIIRETDPRMVGEAEPSSGRSDPAVVVDRP